MTKSQLLAASALSFSVALAVATPAAAQTANTTTSQNTAPTNGPGQEATTGQTSGAPATTGTATPATTYGGDIVVTAQRQSQRLQDVPIAVSAFTADNLAKQQIVNPLALQQTLPNVTFTKTNFTSSSFTIRGIGDLCTGTTCDSATAIHVNDMPLVSTRLFESEFYDLERVEVLRGPQGTLFGRNATSGVVNFITAKPDLSAIHAAGEFEYGNYDSKKAKAMFNLPLTDTIGIRVAGLYLNRDGYTQNLYNNTRIDDRDLYSVRGTLSWQPDADTRLDLIGYYFHENDARARSQKQLCHRDPTGILGCLPDRLGYDTLNGNATLSGIQSSRQFLALATGSAAASAFGLGSLYGTDTLAASPNPASARQVYDDYNPTYYAMEQQYQAKLFHDFGPVSLNITGGYAKNRVDSTEDYTQAVESSLAGNPGLQTLAGAALAPGAAFVGGVNPFAQLARVLIPQGPNGPVCQSAPTPNDGGVYAGASLGCYPQSIDVDRSNGLYEQWSVETHIDSKFDGPFNFLLGGIYLNQTIHQNDYYVNAFGLDYAAGILPTLARSTGAIPAALGPVQFATPFYRNNEERYRLKSYGIFGETYFQLNDAIKITLGLRYNHDDKFLQARNTYLVDSTTPTALNPLLPYGATNLSQAYNYAALDYDSTVAGAQPYALGEVGFNRVTGRGVIDWKITPNNLLYFSYSRGYKSGGINPPVPAAFAVPTTFNPEKVDSFEIGSKNTFLGGALRLNATGFYYKYKDLQLARIVARTSINDNVSADIYGVELEAVIAPTPRVLVNANFSYLHSRVSDDKLLSNPRDPSGGRTDAVIIKDATNASNCAVLSNVGSALAARGFVNAVNAGTNAATGAGLQPAVPVYSNGTYGAFSVCSALQNAAAGAGAAALGGITVYSTGVPVNIRGNQLPQAPTFKASMGAQYTLDLANGWTIVPRADINLTGNSYAGIFNLPIDRNPAYEVINAQIQLNGRNELWFLRAFVQNATNSQAITGQYVTDQSSGLFTNVFTLEPRRYGASIGFKF